jgi:alpha-glucosidase
MRIAILLAAATVTAAASVPVGRGQGQPPSPPRELIVRSPDGRTIVTVSAGGQLRWSATRDGRPIVGDCSAGLTIDGRALGRGAVRDLREATADETVTATFYPRRRSVRDRYRQLTVTLDDGLSFVMRAYDDGVAYRLVTDVDRTVRIDREEVRLRFPGEPVLYAPLADCSKSAKNGVDCYHTSFEETYTVRPLREFPPDRPAFLPVLLDHGAGQPKVLVTEADLIDYPGLWLRAGRESGPPTSAELGAPTSSRPADALLTGEFAAYPLEEKVIGTEYPQQAVVRRANYIGETGGRRQYPWRVFAIADRDVDLPASDIVYRLGGTTEPGDWSWLRPGKSQSEWLWDNILYDVPFTSGLNTATYRHYVEFAKRFGTGYVFFDAGWSQVTDPLTLTPGLDVPQLVREARQQDLGVVLWTSSLAMGRQMDSVLDQFQGWNVTGVMVDFMDRDDQPTVRFYERVARETAKRRMLANFHGAFKPTGLERRFPNAVTREAVVASEYHKWSDVLTPDYEVTVPFIRGMVGPVDYEPGHMRNAQRDVFRPMGALPMSQGTRMHQAAMYLVYESPYAKMGGNVSDYEREPEFTRFLASIPTIWTETRAIDGRIADYVVMVRKAADGTWWAGALTDWTARELSLPLTFLPNGTFTVEIWQDGPNAARYAPDWRHVAQTAQATDALAIRMAPGGGWVARIR